MDSHNNTLTLDSNTMEEEQTVQKEQEHVEIEINNNTEMEHETDTQDIFLTKNSELDTQISLNATNATHFVKNYHQHDNDNTKSIVSYDDDDSDYDIFSDVEILKKYFDDEKYEKVDKIASKLKRVIAHKFDKRKYAFILNLHAHSCIAIGKIQEASYIFKEIRRYESDLKNPLPSDLLPAFIKPYIYNLDLTMKKSSVNYVKVVHSANRLIQEKLKAINTPKIGTVDESVESYRDTSFVLSDDLDNLVDTHLIRVYDLLEPTKFKASVFSEFCENCAAYFSVYRNNSKQAVQFCEKNISFLRKIHDVRWNDTIFAQYGHIISIYTKFENFTAVEQICKGMLNDTLLTNQVRRMAIYDILGRSLSIIGKQTEAIDNLVKSLLILQDTQNDNHKQIGKLHQAIATSYIRAGNYFNAGISALNAEACFEKCDYAANKRVHTWTCIADSMYHNKDFNGASEWYNRILTYYKHKNNQESISSTLLQLVKCHVNQSQFEKALAYIMQIVKLRDYYQTETVLDAHLWSGFAFIYMAMRGKCDIHNAKQTFVKIIRLCGRTLTPVTGVIQEVISFELLSARTDRNQCSF